MEYLASPYHLMPISKLPFELLIVIFQHGVEEEFSSSLTEPLNPYRHPISFVRRVSQVCRSWREISRNAPTLWATMPYYESYGARWIDEFLKLSQESLLTIRLSAGLRSRNVPPSNISALYNHSHRIHTLYGTTHSSAPPSDFQKLLRGPMPSLQTLVLSYGFGAWNIGNSSVATVPELLRAGAPSLTTLISFRCLADLSSPAFSQLRVLEIHDIPAPYSPNVSQWLDSLRNMASLRKLSITQSILFDDTKTIIDMPCLRVLRYSGDFVGFELLGQFLAPRLEQLDLSLACGHPPNVFIPEETIEDAFCRSLHNWEARLAEHTLGLRLTHDRLVIQTLSSPQFRLTEERVQLLVELQWTTNKSIPHDVDVIVDSIGGSLQRAQFLATRIDLPTSLDGLHVDPIPSRLSVSLSRFFDRLSHVHQWMGYSIADVYALSSLLLGDKRSGVIFPSLDTFSLRVGPSVWQSRWIKSFIEGRNLLGKPIQVIRIPGVGELGLGDDLGCRIENDDKSLEVFVEQGETKHVSTELHRQL